MSKHSPEDLEAIRHLINNKPEEDFCGLSSNEMHRLLYETFEPNSPLHISQTISDPTLDSLPFFRLTEEFLKIIARHGQIKLTPLGALPKKTLIELYSHRLILEEGVETGIHKLTKEADSLALSALHYNTVFSGLTRKAAGKLILTKEGKRLLTSRNRKVVLLKTLHAY